MADRLCVYALCDVCLHSDSVWQHKLRFDVMSVHTSAADCCAYVDEIRAVGSVGFVCDFSEHCLDQNRKCITA